MPLLFLMACGNENMNSSESTETRKMYVLDSLNLFGNGNYKGNCIEGNCIDGKGKYEIEETYIYDGFFKNGKAHGKGLLSMPEGHFKEGQWEEGRLKEGKEYNGFDSMLYVGNFISLIGAADSSSLLDVPHGKGTIQYKNEKTIDIEYDSGEIVAMQGIKYTSFYADERQSCEKTVKAQKHLLRKKPTFNATFQSKYALKNFKNVRLFGKPYIYGIKGFNKYEVLYGKMIRAMRFQNITQAVEKRYGLPENILLAMIMIESSGIRYFPNAQDDGGIGLAHMQGIVANEFGLETICETDCKIVCKKHGKQLRTSINEYNYQDNKLIPVDDRFSPLLNLDAVGRMLAYYQFGERKINPSIKKAISYYAGMYNFKKSYWKNIKYYMGYLNNPVTVKSLEKAFNERNRRSNITFKEYIDNFQSINYNYGLQEYIDLCQKEDIYLPPRLPKPAKLDTPCYVVVIWETSDKIRAAKIANIFAKKYPLVGYIRNTDYPNTFDKPSMPFYYVYLRVHKDSKQIIQLYSELRSELGLFATSMYVFEIQ